MVDKTVTVPAPPTRSLHRKLAQVMYEAESIPKNGKAPAAMGGFTFVQVGDAAKVIRKALAEKNVSMIPSSIELLSESEHPTQSGKMMTTITVRTTWTITDGETGETAVIQSMGSGADMGDKAAPKAQSNAMKYALLMGFLLSTGDDPELSDSSDRQRRPPPVQHDEPVQVGDDGLIGTVEMGKPPVDMQPRAQPEGGEAWGFALKDGNRRFQVLAKGLLADQLAMLPDLVGQRVKVFGVIEMIVWYKNDKAMPPFPRVHASRIEGPDWKLPEAEPVDEDPVLDPVLVRPEAATVPLFEEAS